MSTHFQGKVAQVERFKRQHRSFPVGSRQGQKVADQACHLLVLGLDDCESAPVLLLATRSGQGAVHFQVHNREGRP